MTIQEILLRRLNSLINPTTESLFFRTFLSLGALLIGTPTAVAIFSVSLGDTTLTAELSNGKSWLSIAGGTVCLAIAIFFYVIKKRQEHRAKNDSAPKNAPIVFSRLQRDGEVAKRVTPYGNDQVVILCEFKDKTSNKITISKINKDGTKEPSFGNSGKITLDINGSENNSAGNIMTDESGNLLIAAHSVSEGRFKIALCRILKNGIIDRSFGTNGFSSIETGNSGHEYAMSAILNADGSMISVGHQFETKRLLAAKFEIDGRPDNSFGDGGFITHSSTNDHDWGVDLAVSSPDEKILFLFNSGARNSYIVRVNRNGAIDKSFGEEGLVNLQAFLSPGDLMRATSITLQSDGKILVAGYGNQGLVMRLHEDGSIDREFARNGKKVIRANHRTDLQKIISKGDGQIFIAGAQSDGNSIMEGVISSLNSEGEIVSTFGEDGFIIIRGETKHRITDIEFTNNSELALIGEESSMSNGYENTFIGFLPI